MCAVSAVTDYYREKWPVPGILPTIWPTAAPPVFFPLRTITEAEWQEYQELKRRMEDYDRRTGQPDCVKPEVAAWEAAIESEIAINRVGANNDIHE